MISALGSGEWSVSRSDNIFGGGMVLCAHSIEESFGFRLGLEDLRKIKNSCPAANKLRRLKHPTNSLFTKPAKLFRLGGDLHINGNNIKVCLAVGINVYVYMNLRYVSPVTIFLRRTLTSRSNKERQFSKQIYH